MKHITLIVLVLILLFPKNSNAQDNGAAVAGAVGALAAIGAGIAAIEQMKERDVSHRNRAVVSQTSRKKMSSFSLNRGFRRQKIKGYVFCICDYV